MQAVPSSGKRFRGFKSQPVCLIGRALSPLRYSHKICHLKERLRPGAPPKTYWRSVLFVIDTIPSSKVLAIVVTITHIGQ